MHSGAGLRLQPRCFLLYRFFTNKVFVRRRGSKIAKKPFYLESFTLSIGHSECFAEKLEYSDDPFKLLIPCCPNKILFSLSFDANLAKFSLFCEKLYETFSFLDVYYNFVLN